jgi:WD40 repeat protein/tRNA A-37 threonylcarbamoyl transferase component Bud32
MPTATLPLSGAQFAVDSRENQSATDSLASPDRAEGAQPTREPFAFAPPGYEIVRELGRGGMGVVYLARDLALHRLVALKVIRAGELAADQERQRFSAEGRAAARLQHGSVVQVFHVGEHAGLPFVVLEYVEGQSLKQRLQGQPLPAAEAARLVLALCAGVQHAHEAGIIHRDLKPSNVLLDRQGRPKVADFGLAKALDADAGQTQTGQVLGTPSYMPPEQAAGRSDAGALVDVYALGAILYECLTGRPPFRGATVRETLEQVRTREPVAPRSLNPGVPRDLETICLKCLEKSPERRYASVQALAEDLQRYLEGRPILARPVGWLERSSRWVRRNPLVATLAGLVVVLLVATTAGSIYAAFLFRAERDEQVRLRGEADSAATLARTREESERQERIEKDRALGQEAVALDKKNESLGRLYTGLGLRLADQGDTTGSLAYFAQALIEDGIHPARSRMHRLRLAAYASQAPPLRFSDRAPAPIAHATFSPDGRFLVLEAEQENRAFLYDLVTGKRTDLQHQRTANHAPTFSPDGLRLVVTPREGPDLWDTAAGQPLTGENSLKNWGGPRSRLLLFGAASQGPLGLLAAQEIERTLGQHSRQLGLQQPNRLGASFSPDGRWLLSHGGSIPLLRDARTGQPWLPDPFADPFRQTVSAHTFLSPAGRYLLHAESSGSRYFLPRLEDAQTGRWLSLPVHCPLDSLHLVHAKVLSFWNQDGTRLLLTEENEARLWNPQTGEPATPPMSHPTPVQFACFDPTGRHVLTVCYGSDARDAGPRAQLWDAARGAAIGEPFLDKDRRAGFGNLRASGQNFAFLRDGPGVVIWGSQRQILIWSPAPPERGPARPTTLFIPYPPLASPTVQVDDEGRYLVVSGVDEQSRRGEAWVWNLAAPLRPPEVFGLASVSNQEFQVVLSPGGDRLALVSRRAIQVYFPGQPESVTLLPPGNSGIAPTRERTSLCWAPDGRHLLALSADRQTFWFWDTERRSPTPINGYLRRYVETRDGDRALVSTLSGVQVVATATGAAVGPALPNTDTVPFQQGPLVQLSGNGERLLTVPRRANEFSFSLDREFQVRDVRTGAALYPPVVAVSPGTVPVLAPDGVTLANLDGSRVQYWNASTDQPLNQGFEVGPGEATRSNIDARAETIRFTPSGQFVRVNYADGTTRFFPRNTESAPGSAGSVPALPPALKLTGPADAVSMQVRSAGRALVRIDPTTLAVQDLLDPHPGTVRLRTARPVHSAVLGSGARALVVDEAGTATIFDTVTGAVVGEPWTAATPVLRVLIQDLNFLLVSRREVVARNPATGKLAWRIEAEDDIIDILSVPMGLALVHARSRPGEAPRSTATFVRLWRTVRSGNPAAELKVVPVGEPIPLDGPFAPVLKFGQFVVVNRKEIQTAWLMVAGDTRLPAIPLPEPAEAIVPGDATLALYSKGKVRIKPVPGQELSPPLDVGVGIDRLFITATHLCAVRDDAVLSWLVERPQADPARVPLPVAPQRLVPVGSTALGLVFKDDTLAILDPAWPGFLVPPTPLPAPPTLLVGKAGGPFVAALPGGRLSWLLPRPANGKPTVVSAEVGGEIESLQQTEAGRVLVRLKGGTVQVWSLQGNTPMRDGSTTLPAVDLQLAAGEEQSFVRIVERDGPRVRLFDGASGQLRATLEHTSPVSEAVAADRWRLVTVTEDRTFRTWRLLDGQPLLPSRTLDDAREGPFGESLTRADNTLWAISRGKEVVVWNTFSGRPTTRPLPFDDPVRKAFFWTSDRIMILAGNTCRLVNVATGKDVFPPVDHGEEIRWVQGFTTLTRRGIATVGATRVRFWDLEGKPLGKPVESADAEGAWRVETMISGPAGILMTTGKELISWDGDKDQLRGTCPLPEGVIRFTIPNDQKHGIFETRDGVYRAPLDRLNGSPGTARIEPIQPRFNLAHADIDATGSRVVTVTVNGQAQVWDAGTGRTVGAPIACAGAEAIFSPDGRHLFLVGSVQTVLVDSRTGHEIARIDWKGSPWFPGFLSLPGPERIRFGEGKSAWQLASPVGGLPKAHGGVLRWDLESGTSHRLTLEAGSTPFAVCSRTGRVVVTRPLEGNRTEVRLRASGREEGWVEPFRAEVSGELAAAAFSPDGKWLLLESQHRSKETISTSAARVWEVETGRPLAALPTGTGAKTAGYVAGPFTPDGTGVFVVNDRSVRIHDVVTGEPLTPSFRGPSTIMGLRVLASGKSLLVQGSGSLWLAPLFQEGQKELLERTELLAGRRVEAGGSLVEVPPQRLVELAARYADRKTDGDQYRQLLIAGHRQFQDTNQKPEAALARASAWLALDPTPAARRRHAEVLTSLARYAEACDDYTRLLDEDGSQESDTVRLAYLTYYAGRGSESLPLMQKAAAAPGASLQARAGLAVLGLYLNRPEVYKSMWPELVAVAERDGDADFRLEALRLALLRVEPGPDAERLVAIARRLREVREGAFPVLLEGMAVYRAGRPAQALGTLQEALTMSFRNFREHTDMFRTLHGLFVGLAQVRDGKKAEGAAQLAGFARGVPRPTITNMPRANDVWRLTLEFTLWSRELEEFRRQHNLLPTAPLPEK